VSAIRSRSPVATLDFEYPRSLYYTRGCWDPNKTRRASPRNKRVRVTSRAERSSVSLFGQLLGGCLSCLRLFVVTRTSLDETVVVTSILVTQGAQRSRTALRQLYRNDSNETIPLCKGEPLRYSVIKSRRDGIAKLHPQQFAAGECPHGRSQHLYSAHNAEYVTRNTARYGCAGVGARAERLESAE